MTWIRVQDPQLRPRFVNASSGVVVTIERERPGWREPWEARVLLSRLGGGLKGEERSLARLSVDALVQQLNGLGLEASDVSSIVEWMLGT